MLRPCNFGIDCYVQHCGYYHPPGRYICPFGENCNDVDCASTHPPWWDPHAYVRPPIAATVAPKAAAPVLPSYSTPKAAAPAVLPSNSTPKAAAPVLPSKAAPKAPVLPSKFARTVGGSLIGSSAVSTAPTPASHPRTTAALSMQRAVTGRVTGMPVVQLPRKDAVGTAVAKTAGVGTLPLQPPSTSTAVGDRNTTAATGTTNRTETGASSTSKILPTATTTTAASQTRVSKVDMVDQQFDVASIM
jgi:hypothetical protein